MPDPITVPLPSEALVGEANKPAASWYRVFQRLIGAFNDAVADAAGKAVKGQAWQEAFLIEFAENKDYDFIDFAYGFTIASVVTQSKAGTCTATVKINTTALGGSANSVSTSEQTQAHSSANVLAAGDNLRLTISSNAGAEGVSITVKGTRTLA